MNDRRVAFFLIAAVVCFLMAPLAPAAYQWVPVATGITYVCLAILVIIESLGRRSPRQR